MPSIVYEIADLLGCKVNQLAERITHPDAREKVKSFLVGRNFFTTYQRGRSPKVRCDDLSKEDAVNTLAYNGLYHITVQQHYFAKRRIHLMYPRLPLVVMRTGPSRQPMYFPMELLSSTSNANGVSIEMGENDNDNAYSQFIDSFFGKPSELTA